MPNAAAASLAWGSSALTVMSIVAFESVSCLTMSLAVNNTLIVVAVAPARRMPWKAIANAELLGASRSDDVADADAAIGQRAGECIDFARPRRGSWFRSPVFASTSAMRSASASSMLPNR